MCVIFSQYFLIYFSKQSTKIKREPGVPVILEEAKNFSTEAIEVKYHITTFAGQLIDVDWCKTVD